MLLVVVGITVSLVGGVWFLVESFRESIWWGLGCLLINPIQFIFLIVHWDVAKKPFGVEVLGFVILLAGVLLSEPGMTGV